MFEEQIFAVVDLETTGTKKNEHERIFQFGCALIQHGQIIKTVSYLINPQKELPPVIENLTGISNQDLVNQPDFKHFAASIKKLLAGTIFVAHNVNFDLPFLNYELMNAGFDPLDNYSLDTVELAQIAFPTFSSFKLQDLTKSLHIKHTNPHQADSDAVVTAKLLLKIIERLKGLPQATLHLLTSLAKGLTRNNDYLFEEIAKYNRQAKRPLPKNLIQIKSLVLQKQNHQFNVAQTVPPQYPESSTAKKELFKKKIRYRASQVALMDKIHAFIDFDLKHTDFLAEAQNGTGKTLSYLFSYAYQLSSLQKLVVATPTKVLQQQIVTQEISQLNKVTELNLQAEVVKSSSHYLDLDGFYQTLYSVNQNKANLILQMRIIVWLTQTTTGDLDELQLTTMNTPLFAFLKHPGDARMGTDFSEVDFWNHARYNQEQADILVTNHAYLANHYLDSIWGQNPYLVVDEAHRFVDNVINSNYHSLRFESFWGTLNHLKSLLIFSTENSNTDLLGQDLNLSLQSSEISKQLLNVIGSINELQTLLYQSGMQESQITYKKQHEIEIITTGESLAPQLSEILQVLKRLQEQIDLVRNSLNNLIDNLLQIGDSLLNSDQTLVDELTVQIDRIDLYAEDLYLFADQIADPEKLNQRGFVLDITNQNDPLSTNISWLNIDAREELTKIYQRFQKRTFISATITNQDDFSYSIQELGLNPDLTQTCRIKPNKKWQENLQVTILDDPTVSADPSSLEYLEFLGKNLGAFSQGNDHVLILFTNLETLKEVYYRLLKDPSLADYELLAQGITGTNEKIAKRFTLAQKTVLLGANSFFEGIDFKNTAVDQVIITRLPFESPDQPGVVLRQERLKQEGIDFFQEDMLPRAIIRFRQACGRLIRHENDQGEFLVLDQRINRNSYGSLFKESLGVTQINYLTAKELDNEKHE